MAASFKTKYIVIYYCWVMFLCPAFAAEAQVYASEFYRAANPNYVILNAVTSEKATSIIQCAIKCLNYKCSCYSFNKLQQRCNMGTCTRTNTSTGTSDEIYVQCNTAAGFELLTIGSAKACVWVSTTTADYVSARDDCKAKGASLYTARTKDKLRWLIDNLASTFFWIGLSDKDVEGELRWDDDYTICNVTCIGQIFEGIGPSDMYPEEDCVEIMVNKLLNDVPCTKQSRFICENPFFNWP